MMMRESKNSRPPQISAWLREGPPVFSVEFFPPKNEEGGELLWKTAGQLVERSRPDFVSITYGAGGGTRARTHEFACKLQNEKDLVVMPHLTCVGSTKADLQGIIKEYYEAGFRNIMALRGDPPKGETEFTPYRDGLRYGGDLVQLIKESYPDICVGAGAYPEKHPEADSPDADIEALKRKVDQGADFLTTQLFYDNQLFFRFRDRCEKAGITVPMLPGILPVLSLSQVRRFAGMCGCNLPRALESQLNRVEGNDEAVQAVGIDWAYHQIRDLVRGGAPGYHLYILNRSEAALALIDTLAEK